MPNRLANETSPYLLQHADNPVDWYPWGDEALDRARTDDKPIFLSIGYSACHWCHVMEHESFENGEIADYLNRHFVSIKVDREERPDLDQIYMQAVMAMTGRGGWPLSAFLTPDQEFFFGGTYWPPVSRARMPGFDRVLASVVDAWNHRREELTAQSRQITEMIRAAGQPLPGAHDPNPELIDTAERSLHRRFDSRWGGFGPAPKFPHAMDLALLLLRARRRRHPALDDTRDPGAPPLLPRETLLEMAEVTLQRMALGGIRDHLGGGFARYSVDEQWLVPHFEKMLYDNAMLARVYMQAFRATGSAFYEEVCRSTLDYLLGDMTDPQGGFWSAEDADSEGEEGKFYVWTDQEVMELLGEETGALFSQIYNVSPHGNFEGRNILNLRETLPASAARLGLDARELDAEMARARATLLTARNRRVRPRTDDKVIAAWNGMAIEALADTAIGLDEPRYAEAALRAATFVHERMRDADGRLLHTWRKGQARLPAYLDDYAWMICAFLDCYRLGFDGVWVQRAVELATDMVARFHDGEGGFFYTADDHEPLIARMQDYQDNAIPGGNSMAALACLRLGRMTGDTAWLDLASQTMRAAMPLLSQAPLAGSQMLIAIDMWFHGDRELALVEGDDKVENERVTNQLRQGVPLDGTLIVARRGTPLPGALAAMMQDKTAIDGQVSLYVCESFRCAAPLVGAAAIKDYTSGFLD